MIVETIFVNLVDFFVYFSLQAYILRAQFRLPGIDAEESILENRAPIWVNFEISYFIVSVIQVSYGTTMNSCVEVILENL